MKNHPEAFRPFMRANVQLIVEPHCVESTGDNPLSALHEAFSRFKFIIISGGMPVSMNMRVFSDTGECYMTAKESFSVVKSEHVKEKLQQKKKTGVSPAFSLVFKSGNYTKGKTAAQVLAEDPENGRKTLESQRKWLSDNLSRYKGNQPYLDAIDEALQLPASALTTVESSVSYKLFSSEIRVLEKEKNKNGKSLVYEGAIRFIPGMDYPTTVTIKNCYCSVKKDEKGLIQPVMSTKEDATESSISLNFSETLRLFEEMELYYRVKSEQLTALGITRSEKEAQEGRKNRSNAPKNPPKPEPSSEILSEILSVKGKTPCVERSSYPGDYSMQGYDEAGEILNIVIPNRSISKMGKIFPQFVKRSKELSDPVFFKAEFERSTENGRSIAKLIRFVS